MELHSQSLEIARPLGPGDGFSQTHLAVDRVGGGQVVLRRFHNIGPRPDRDIVAQFRLHLALGDCGFAPGEDLIRGQRHLVGYTIQYLKGVSLAEDAIGLSGSELLLVLADVCAAVANLHALGYVHCDLTPQNIFVTRAGSKIQSFVTDLGLAAMDGADFPTEIRGTAGFVAPELYEGLPIAPGSDVYAMGRVIQTTTQHISDPAFRGQLDGLIAACTNEKPSDRPTSMWDVRHHLLSVFRGLSPDFTPPEPRLVLRDSGLARRAASLETVILDSLSKMILVGGPPGIGKSRVLRELCLRAQAAGRRTLRVREVSDLSHLVRRIDHVPTPPETESSPPADASEHVFVETTRLASPRSADLEELRNWADARGAVVFIECGERPPPNFPDGVVYQAVGALSERECIHATSPHVANPSISVATGRSLHIATGGNPRLMQLMLKHGGQCPLRQSPDFDALPPLVRAYWSERLDRLSDGPRHLLERCSVFHEWFSTSFLLPLYLDAAVSEHGLRDLVDTGWLRVRAGRGGENAYSFSSRSARNVVRSLTGRIRLSEYAASALEAIGTRDTAWASDDLEGTNLRALSGDGIVRRAPVSLPDGWLSRNLADVKLRLYDILRGIRSVRTDNPTSADLFRAIVDGLGTLGRPEAQRRWACRALDLFTDDRVAQDHAAPQAIADVCRLFDVAADANGKERWLRERLDRTRGHGSAVRGYLLTELGGLFLSRNKPKDAMECLHDAEACLGNSGAHPVCIARNLGRMGIGLTLLGKTTMAIPKLRHAHRLAEICDDGETRLHALANLGWAAQLTGDPHAAMALFRRVSRICRDEMRLNEYVTTLTNQVTCLVDLGRGFQALRVARLAVTLAQTLNDPILLAHATNNLGWVLTMRGALREARQWLVTSTHMWERAGSSESAKRPRLNMARLYRVARLLDRAEGICREISSEAPESPVVLRREIQRELARLALGRADSQRARVLLEAMPDDQSPPVEDPIVTRLLSAQVSLWAEDATRATEILVAVAEDPVLARIAPLALEHRRLLGHTKILEGRHDIALSLLSRVADDAGRAGRIDHVLDVLPLFALLAEKMGNAEAGLRYLDAHEQMTSAMRAELTDE